MVRYYGGSGPTRTLDREAPIELDVDPDHGIGILQSDRGVELELTDNYGQFDIMHVNQDGVIR